MKKFMKKARESFKDNVDGNLSAAAGRQVPLRQNDTPTTRKPPSPVDVMRYRYQHGTNLGSIFVLEQWLYGSMFVAGAKGGSELDAVQASLKANGLDATRQKWEAHWNSAVTGDDWNWLVNTAHCSTIRLPIGYFTLGPSYCSGTPFAGQNAQVYVNAWTSVRNFVAAARSHGIGVLIDFHAVPGGANPDEHSGTSSGKAELWSNKQNLSLAQNCLVFIAQQARTMDGVVGIELVNEATANAPGLYQFYDSVIGAISQVDSTMPVYISDGWDLNTAVTYSNGKNAWSTSTNPIVIDTHKYYCFADNDKKKSPQQIISGVSGELSELNGREGDVFTHGAAQVVVDEYSCVLDEQTWSKVNSDQRPGLITQFGQAESKQWQARSGGSTFWTFKMDWMDGGEWGFKQQTNNGNVYPPRNLTLSAADVRSKISTAQSQQAGLKSAASSAHRNYWSQQSPGQTFEFWRFDTGYDVGFADALAFFGTKVNGALPGTGGDKIGMLDLWVRKRIFESGQAGSYVWEFEQGLRQAIGESYRAMGV
ncbi:MAG: Glucan 1,3-beta-glucosidase 3 [Sclerophora amabilis]|nr:MAG: Glucan 1,3-beta-glucosidase 3 [Sclerophora amabilis]